MPLETLENNNIHVGSQGLADFLADVESAINLGYKFDFETNENYPQVSGWYYTAILIPKTEEDLKKEKKVSKLKTA